MKLRYSEAFYSIQGEGRYVGVPSVFLRTFGCNFRCKLFGRDKSESYPGLNNANPEVEAIINNIDQYNEFKELPIVHTGCDTYASIYPQFKRFMKDDNIDGVVDYLLSLTPNGKWMLDDGQDIHAGILWLCVQPWNPLGGNESIFQAFCCQPAGCCSACWPAKTASPSCSFLIYHHLQ